MPKKRCPLWIKSAREKIERHAPAVRAQSLRVAHTGKRMIIGNEIKRFALGLERDGWPHHAAIRLGERIFAKSAAGRLSC